jgi:hypothetical protein
MARRPARSKLAFVTPREINLRLSCRVDGDEVAGHVSDGIGDGRDFSGWLGLLAAIDALLYGTDDERVSDAA